MPENGETTNLIKQCLWGYLAAHSRPRAGFIDALSSSEVFASWFTVHGVDDGSITYKIAICTSFDHGHLSIFLQVGMRRSTSSQAVHHLSSILPYCSLVNQILQSEKDKQMSRSINPWNNKPQFWGFLPVATLEDQIASISAEAVCLEAWQKCI